MRTRLSIIIITAMAFTLPLAAQSAPWTEDGVASWYGAEFQGKPTASGEIFNPAALTAAHRTLPFGTMVRVRNLANGQEVTVRVNDRGPFVAGRVIDLSQAAAQKLGVGSAGTLNVRLSLEGAAVDSFTRLSGAQAVPPPASAAPSVPAASAPVAAGAASVAPAAPVSAAPAIPPSPWRSVQVGSFASSANARSLIDSLALQGVAAVIEPSADGLLFRVVIQNVAPTAVDALVLKLRGLGHAQVLVRQR